MEEGLTIGAVICTKHNKMAAVQNVLRCFYETQMSLLSV